MMEKRLRTAHGTVCYWITDSPASDRKWLIFLPGLSAEHHLFDHQISYFEKRYNCLTWDAPAHGLSRPYTHDFSLSEIAKVLHRILEKEFVKKPIVIGQSFGAYIAQMYAELYHGALGGFVSIDSAPLEKRYYSAADLWFLRHMEGMYRLYPDRLLRKSVVKQCCMSERGRKNMQYALSLYSPRELCSLTGAEYRALERAIRADRAYRIDCPMLLLCGKKDRVGFVRIYNAFWHSRTGAPLLWVEQAAHNANYDNPGAVNRAIEAFLKNLDSPDQRDGSVSSI